MSCCTAGAINIGKTNLDQFASGLVGTRTPFGVAANAFDNRFIPGGSSSGSAPAVGLRLLTFALGTDTAGSGRVPAGYNGCVGIKGTVGKISTVGEQHFALSASNCELLLLPLLHAAVQCHSYWSYWLDFWACLYAKAMAAHVPVKTATVVRRWGHLGWDQHLQSVAQRLWSGTTVGHCSAVFGNQVPS